IYKYTKTQRYIIPTDYLRVKICVSFLRGAVIFQDLLNNISFCLFCNVLNLFFNVLISRFNWFLSRINSFLLFLISLNFMSTLAIASSNSFSLYSCKRISISLRAGFMKFLTFLFLSTVLKCNLTKWQRI